MSYLGAIVACGVAVLPQRALDLLDEMESRADEMESHGRSRDGGASLRPDSKTYCAAISAMEKAAQWDDALRLLERMRARGVAPDANCFNATISACEKGRQWERALALLREMEECGVPPNEISYSAAITSCDKGNQQRHALELLQQAKDRRLISTPSYVGAISACERAGWWERALELVEEVERASRRGGAVQLNVKVRH